jgi:hypothetical protein
MYGRRWSLPEIRDEGAATGEIFRSSLSNGKQAVGLSGKSDSDIWRLSIDRGQTLLACGLPLYISKAHGMIEAPDKNLLWRIPAALNLSAQESIKIRRRPLKSDCFDRSSVGELTFIR